MKTIILSFFTVLLITGSAHALTTEGKIDSLTQQGDTLYFTINSIDINTTNLSMINFVFQFYQSEYTVIADYDDSTFALVAINTDNTLYPVKDFSQIVSFLIGGVAAASFIMGIKIRYTPGG